MEKLYFGWSIGICVEAYIFMNIEVMKVANVLSRITAFDKNKGDTKLESTALEMGKGIVGDRHFSSEKNQITILFMNAGGVDKDVDKHGLCTAKFKANLEVDADESLSIQPDTKLTIGTATLRIAKSKPCYDDCKLHKDGRKCSLVGNAFFASVDTGGVISVGDDVLIFLVD